MKLLLINLALYLGYVVVNAKEDSKLAKLGGLDHRWNWFLTAIVAIITAYNIYRISWEAVTYLFMLMPITWLIFDPAANFFLGKRGTKVFTYIGTGGIDKWFKANSNTPVKAMYICKGMAILATVVIHIIVVY